MPYENELASKASHYDFVRNPDVKAFLQDCTFLKPPSEEEGKIFAARFQVPPPTDGLDLPRFVMAIDGSYHESEINEQLPSTRIGFVKVGCILVDMGTFASLKVLEGRYVDPFRVAELQENNSALTFALPSANVRWGTRQDVRTSFRAALDAHLYGPITRFVESDPKTSLRTTLFHLASRRPKEMGTGDDSVLKLHKCPECERGPIEVRDIPDPQFCPHCHGEIFPSDCLRIWEEVSEYQSGVTPLWWTG